MICTACRRFVPQGASRCPACGASFGAPVAVAVKPAQAAIAARSAPASCPTPHKHPTIQPARPTRAASRPRLAVQSAPQRHPQVLAEGTVVAGGRYWLGPLLGQGSFGITYRGIDQRLDRAIAIKEFFPEGSYRQNGTVVPPPSLGRAGYEAEREHFIQEARVLARFQRPGIVSVYEVFEENDTAYMVMEYLAGRTLVEVLRDRGESLPVADALRYTLAVADALAAVHEQHLLHRDVKPGNIIITPADEAILIDFGAARRYDRYQRTSVMTAIGTPGYAPLEQWGSSGRFGPSSDVYALAATLYHLLTGRMPASATDRAIDDILMPPHELVAAVPATVSAVVLHALAIRMEDRPQTMAAFAAELRAARAARTRGGGHRTPTAPPAVPPTPNTGGATPRDQSAARATTPASVPVSGGAIQQDRSAAPSVGGMTAGGASAVQPRAVSPDLPVPAPPASPVPQAPRGGRLRVRWPRRRLHLFAWAGASLFTPVLFATSIVTITTVLPLLGVLALACTGDLRRAARTSLRGAVQFTAFGFSACAISAGSLCVVAGLTVRGALRGAVSVLG